MSSLSVLKFIAGSKPIFNMDYAILSAPVRHVFMIATVWYLTQHAKNDRLQILEIGSWIGASTLTWAQGLKEHNHSKGTITCVDAWKPFLDHTIHTDEIYLKMEQALSTETAYQLFTHNISTLPSSIVCQHLKGMSEQILPLLRHNTFDIIFIDGDHIYPSVFNDIKNSLPLVKEGGIICGDDLNLQLSEVDHETTTKFSKTDLIKNSVSNRNYHPGVTLAIAEIFGEVSAWGGFWAMQKRDGKWHKISLTNMPISFPEHFPENYLKMARDHFNDLTI